MTVLAEGIPPGTRVSCPTAPWRLRARTGRNGPIPYLLHVVSFIYPDRHIPYALCNPDFILTHTLPATQGTAVDRCGQCTQRLRTHGLWPL